MGYLKDVNYKDQKVKDRDKERLDISYSDEDGMVILFVPNIDEHEHYHIELKPYEYIALYSFLYQYAPVFAQPDPLGFIGFIE